MCESGKTGLRECRKAGGGLRTRCAKSLDKKKKAESSVSAKQILNSRFYQCEAIGKGAHARIAASDATLRCEGSRWSTPLPPQIRHSRILALLCFSASRKQCSLRADGSRSMTVEYATRVASTRAAAAGRKGDLLRRAQKKS